MSEYPLTSKEKVDNYYHTSVEVLRPRLTTYLNGLVEDQYKLEIDDIIQETLVAAYQMLLNQEEAFDKPFSLLRTIARNNYLNLLKKKKKGDTVSLDNITDASGEQNTAPLELSSGRRDYTDIVFESKEDLDRYTEKIKALDEGRVKQVMQLLAEGYTTNEIAEKLGIRSSFVRVCLTQGRRKIREKKNDKGTGTYEG
jgi:RNA polymerase sigma factor (sigma-70 family)